MGDGVGDGEVEAVGGGGPGAVPGPQPAQVRPSHRPGRVSWRSRSSGDCAPRDGWGTGGFSEGRGQSSRRPRLPGREATQARTVSAYQKGLPPSTWSGGGSSPCLRYERTVSGCTL